MKFSPFFFAVLTLLATGCYRSSDEVWDDTLTAGHHMGRSFETLGGKRGDSRQVQSSDDFYIASGNGTPFSPDFMNFFDGEGSEGYTMSDIRPSVHSPGDPGSVIPGIEGFKEPAGDAIYSKVFRPIHFDYNSNQVKGQENNQILQNMAGFLKQHPNLYLFLEGHCDNRGPEAYNFALGSRRANEVRAYLVSQGISPDRLFTVSYGKERPLSLGDDDASHQLNRRVAFKIYDR